MTYEIEIAESPVAINASVETRYTSKTSTISDDGDYEITTAVGKPDLKVMDAFGSRFALIVPGGILKRIYLYKQSNSGTFVKLQELKTDVKMGKAVVHQQESNNLYIIKADASVSDS